MALAQAAQQKSGYPPSTQPNSSRRPAACPFCDRTFSRVDSARRHTKNCPVKGDRPLPSEARPGRRLRSCDACSRVKVLCNAKRPCQRCVSRKVTCTYERLCADRTHQRALARGNASYTKLRFLLSCTDPRLDFFNDVLMPGEPKRDPETLPAWDQFSLNDTEQDNTIDPRLLFLGSADPYFDFSLDHSEFFDNGTSRDNNLAFPLSMEDGLAAQVRTLELDLLQLLQNQSDLNDSQLQSAFREFCTSANFLRLIRAFFCKRQLLAHMIHWPTFDPSKADRGLLLAVALCGVAYSCNSSESSAFAPIARITQMLAEKYIFKRLKQCHAGSGVELHRHLEVCQASYLIITLQSSIKDIETRRRIIVKRQPTLVDALRRLDMLSRKSSSPAPKNDWYSFIHSQTRTRLVNLVLFNEGLSALFCNTPPNMTISEMDGSLPCQEELWHAHTSASFLAQQSKESASLKSPSMKDFMTDLMSDEWDGTVAALYQSLSAFHLYSAVGAFQIVLFNFRANMLPKSFSPVLLRALDRWTRLWQVAINRTPPDQRIWLGMVKYAPEFEFVSRRVIEAVRSSSLRNCSAYIRCAATYDFQAFRNFMLQHGKDCSTTRTTTTIEG